MPKPIVALTRCGFDRPDVEVEQAVQETIELAGGVPEKLKSARKILVKVNYVGAAILAALGVWTFVELAL